MTDHSPINSINVPETTIQLVSRAEKEGWTKWIAYRIARNTNGHDYSVCSYCGWPWPGANNVCVNQSCKGFCTWAAACGEVPTSWIKNGNVIRPRAINETRSISYKENIINKVIKSFQ